MAAPSRSRFHPDVSYRPMYDDDGGGGRGRNFGTRGGGSQRNNFYRRDRPEERRRQTRDDGGKDIEESSTAQHTSPHGARRHSMGSAVQASREERPPFTSHNMTTATTISRRSHSPTPGHAARLDFQRQVSSSNRSDMVNRPSLKRARNEEQTLDPRKRFHHSQNDPPTPLPAKSPILGSPGPVADAPRSEASSHNEQTRVISQPNVPTAASMKRQNPPISTKRAIDELMDSNNSGVNEVVVPDEMRTEIDPIASIMIEFGSKCFATGVLVQQQEAAWLELQRAKNEDEYNHQHFPDFYALIEQGEDTRRAAEEKHSSVAQRSNRATGMYEEFTRKAIYKLLGLMRQTGTSHASEQKKLHEIDLTIARVQEQASSIERVGLKTETQLAGHANRLSSLEQLSSNRERDSTVSLTKFRELERRLNNLTQSNTGLHGLLEKQDKAIAALVSNQNNNDMHHVTAAEAGKWDASIADGEAALGRMQATLRELKARINSVPTRAELEGLRSSTEHQISTAVREQLGKSGATYTALPQDFSPSSVKEDLNDVRSQIQALDDARKKDFSKVAQDVAKAQLDAVGFRADLKALLAENEERDKVVIDGYRTLEEKTEINLAELKRKVDDISTRYLNSDSGSQKTIRDLLEHNRQVIMQLEMERANKNSKPPQTSYVNQHALDDIAALNTGLEGFKDQLAQYQTVATANDHSIRNLNARINNLTTEQMARSMAQQFSTMYPYAANAQAEFTQVREDRASLRKLQKDFTTANDRVDHVTALTAEHHVSITDARTAIEKHSELLTQHGEDIAKVHKACEEADGKHNKLQQQMLTARDELQDSVKFLKKGLPRKKSNGSNGSTYAATVVTPAVALNGTKPNFARSRDKPETVTEHSSMVVLEDSDASPPESAVSKASPRVSQPAKASSVARSHSDRNREGSTAYLDPWLGEPPNNLLRQAKSDDQSSTSSGQSSATRNKLKRTPSKKAGRLSAANSKRRKSKLDEIPDPDRSSDEDFTPERTKRGRT